MADQENQDQGNDQEKEVGVIDFLGMSDEDITSGSFSSMVSAPAETPANPASTELTDKEAEEHGGEPNPAEAQAEAGEGEQEQGQAAATEVTDENQEDGKEKTPANGTKAPAGDAEKAGEGEKGTAEAKADADKPADQVAPPAVDYKAEYEKLMAPFKANGREMKAENIEDARTLMQMGANYNKKMAALKPHLAIVRMLENNGLLDATKLSFLIDVAAKKPEAISKLVQESGIDPLDISAEKAGEYKPSSYTVDDQTVELDLVLDDLKESPAYARTLEVVSTKWDANSKGILAKNPEILRVINGHMESGIYDLIAEQVERERTFGRLKGVSELEAYKATGDAMNEQGKFDHLFKKAEQEHKVVPPAAPAVVEPKPAPASDEALNQKRRAASSTKATAPAPAIPSDFNPLSLPDEEFAKFKPR